MNLQTTTNINVDFCDKKYILINAKQYDKSSRFLSVTCYNRGELYSVNAHEHAAYIRYKKPDGYSVFNFCEINHKGKIIVELTEQMLAVDGLCYADLVIVNKGSASVDANTGEITVADSGILSTMTFCVDVSETAVTNSEIEASSEFIQFNETLEKYWADFEDVVKTSKSWAVGGTGVRDGENTDNAKYYATQSANSANSSKSSATSASTSASKAQDYMNDALSSKQNAQTYMNNAKTYMENASASATSAAGSATSAEASENAAEGYSVNAQQSMNSAAGSATSANASATEAYNYYRQAEAITNSLNGAFLPMGTITFEELAILKENGAVGTGYLYNISNNFTTDGSFRMGAGVEYDAGTNVYFTADGVWDCLAGTTVTGVKGGKETVYRKGNVDITVENIGAISIEDRVTVDEMKSYLGI
jgi:hypothetical protein